jgi:hypothetical protein
MTHHHHHQQQQHKQQGVPIQACAHFACIGPSIFSLVDLHFSCLLENIRTLLLNAYIVHFPEILCPLGYTIHIPCIIFTPLLGLNFIQKIFIN